MSKKIWSEEGTQANYDSESRGFGMRLDWITGGAPKTESAAVIGDHIDVQSPLVV